LPGNEASVSLGWESKDSRWTAGVGASMTQNFGPHGNTNFAYSGGLTFKF